MYSKVKVTLGIVAGALGFAGLAVGLGAIVTSDNAEDCSKIGLKGSLASCKVDNKYAYDKVVILAGNTANTPTPKISAKDKKYILNSYFKNYDDEFKVDIYSATPSMPKIQYSSKVKIDEDTELAELVESLNKVSDEIDKAITTLPSEDGANYYDAIVKLGKKLSNDRENGEKTLLIVLGSGLSDSGTLDFAHNNAYGIYEKKSEEIVSGLEGIDKIDDDTLSGVTIAWSYIGQTKYPQTELPNDQIETLKGVYESLFEKMDAKKVVFDDDLNDNSSSVDTELKVTPTPISNKSFGWGTKSLDEKAIAFESNDWHLKNQQTAAAELSELVYELNSDKNKKATVISYQSKVCGNENALDEELLSKRSLAIKELLRKQGVTNEIETKSGGHGSNSCNDPSARRVEISVN